MLEILLKDSGFRNFMRETIKACENLAEADNEKSGYWRSCAGNLEDFIGNMPSYDEDENDEE